MTKLATYSFYALPHGGNTFVGATEIGGKISYTHPLPTEYEALALASQRLANIFKKYI